MRFSQNWRNLKKNLGGNFQNMARMHNSTDYVKFLEKLYAPFLRKVAKTSVWAIVQKCHEAKYVNSQKSAWIGFLVLNVLYFMPSFGKIVGAVSEKLPLRTDARRTRFYRTLRFSTGDQQVHGGAHQPVN